MTFIPSSPVFVTLFYLSLLIPTPNPTQFDSPIFAFDQHSDSHEFFTGGKEAVPQVSEGNNIFYGVWFFMGFVSDFDVSILTTREAEHARPPLRILSRSSLLAKARNTRRWATKTLFLPRATTPLQAPKMSRRQ